MTQGTTGLHARVPSSSDAPIDDADAPGVDVEGRTVLPCAAGAGCDEGVKRAFEFLGKRWNGVILGTLSAGPVGFADLRRRVGTITDSVLSDRLSELVEAGLVQRSVSDTRPPGVSYALSPSGRELLPILELLGSWATAHLPTRRG